MRGEGRRSIPREHQSKRISPQGSIPLGAVELIDRTHPFCPGSGLLLFENSVAGQVIHEHNERKTREGTFMSNGTVGRAPRTAGAGA